MFRLLLAAPLALIALPAAAHDAPAAAPAPVSAAPAKNCTMQHVHTTPGKMVHHPAVMKCTQAKAKLANVQSNEPQATATK